jgi:neurotransmitter:Na+ symporter, NSS family
MYPAGGKRTIFTMWSSRATFVLAGAGAAVGFNNFWQFPSLVYSNGGGAFVIVYLFCLLLLGWPLLSAAFMIGRLGRDAPDGAFRRTAVQMRTDPTWSIVGVAAILASFLIFSYLAVISGWTVAFGMRSATGAFAGLTADGIASVFTILVTDPERQLFWYTLFITSVVLVAGRGLREGMERAMRYAVPLMFGLMLVALGYAFTTTEFLRALNGALMPDFAKLSWTGVLAAAGHAFFSLGLGAGTMFMLGAYVERDAPIGRLTWYIILLDTAAGLIVALTIYAILYSGGVEPAAGPTLIFQALPLAFDHVPFGQVFLGVFFALLIITVWLSGLALFEPSVAWVVERFGLERRRAAIACGIAAWVVASVNALSFSSWAFTFRFFSETKKFGIFDIFHIATNHVLLPAVGIVTALFAGWVIHTDTAREELGMRSPCAFDVWLWTIRIVVPLTLVAVVFQLSKLYS